MEVRTEPPDSNVNQTIHPSHPENSQFVIIAGVQTVNTRHLNKLVGMAWCWLFQEGARLMLGKGLALRAMSAACSAADALSYHLVFSHFVSQCLTSSAKCAKCAKCYCPNLSKAKCSAFATSSGCWQMTFKLVLPCVC